MRMPPTRVRWRYSHGLIRRCMPGRCGVSHHSRRRFAVLLSLGAFIGIASCELDVGHPAIYQCDITLIDGVSMSRGGRLRPLPSLPGWAMAAGPAPASLGLPARATRLARPL